MPPYTSPDRYPDILDFLKNIYSFKKGLYLGQHVISLLILKMVVISKAIINKFIEKHPASTQPLLKWYIQVKGADWANLSELKQMFSSADYVGNGLVVFNIGGNKWRIIVRIIFGIRTVFVRMVGTHAEYDKVTLSDL